MSKKVLLLIVTAIVVIAGNVWAADPNWLGVTDTNWATATNWSAGVPTTISKANVNKIGTYAPTISGLADANQLYVAESNGVLGDTQTLTVINPGSLYVNQEIVLGFGSNDVGNLLVTSGAVDCNHLFVGYHSGATGSLHIDGGTVNVRKMFGLSWNGGTGSAQLDGGTLHTEQFTFGGAAAMDITAGIWQQEHFWWDKIKSLVWYGKIKGYGARANVVVTWDPAADSNIGHTIVTAVAERNTPSFRIVQKSGGEYSTIQAALNASAAGDVIEVNDSGTYAENLTFPDVNNVTLQAGSGYRPTIALVGADANTLKYILMKRVRTTIQGFNINLSSAATTDGNSTIIFARGGTSTVRDCNIVGPATFKYIRGIAGVQTIEDVQLSNCRDGILCDANQTRTGFQYSISSSPYGSHHTHIYNCERRAILFQDCNAVMDNCLVELCGTASGFDTPGGNVMLTDSSSSTGKITLNVLITNSIIQKAIWGRNINMESKGKVTINDSRIMNALGTSASTHSDEILQYCGTLNLNRCIIKAGNRCGVNMAASGSKSGGICNIDHCDFYDPNMKITSNGQWAITNSDGAATVTIRNSILTGENGYLRNSGIIDSNWNDNDCINTGYTSGSGVAVGRNDIVPKVNPLYIQSSNPADTNFFKLQPYSPVKNADSTGSYMGSQGILAGQEKWPADLVSPHGVDFKDFAALALQWRKDNTIPPIPSSPLVLETFESYTATGDSTTVGTLLGPRVIGGPAAWRVVPANWQTIDPDYYNKNWRRGSSTLSLLTVPPASPNDVNSGSKAMKWEYDVNVPPNDQNAVRYTEILVMLPSAVNLTLYNELRLSLKRLAGNSPDTMTFMYAKFLDLTQGDYPPAPDPYCIVGQVVGGQTATPVGVYSDWTINFDNYVPGVYGQPAGNRTNVGAIIFGIQTQPVKPYDAGKGTIYVDNIRLIDRPGCTPFVEDLTGDCKVDFADVREFALYWLMGKI